ncbi:MAG: hypothetical protein Q4B63_08170 [Clostridium perfringens]|nr:hypothetical protein [Clostridium perfringens]
MDILRVNLEKIILTFIILILAFYLGITTFIFLNKSNDGINLSNIKNKYVINKIL